jgi:type I restriction enzyme S subunit
VTALPSHWEQWRLADTGTWSGGGTPSSTNSDYWNGDVPWVSPKDMKVPRITKTQDYITHDAIENSAAKLIEPHSVLFVTRSGILAHSFPVATNLVPVTVNQDLKVITPTAVVDSEYLAWVLRAQTREILRSCSKHGTTVHSIEVTAIRDLSIPVPPLPEQRRIVAKIEELFSELDNAVASLTAARDQLKTYRQALLKHAFEGKLTADWRAKNPGNARTSTVATAAPADIANLPVLPQEWQYVKLSSIAQIGSGMSVSKNRELDQPIDVPYLRVANVQRGHLNLDHIATMQVERKQLPGLSLQKWDVLFNEGGDRDKLGRGWIWEEEIKPCITQNHVFRASLHEPTQAKAKFLSYWGNQYGQKYFITEGKQTTNLASINRTTLSGFPVPLVHPDEQAAVVSALEGSLTSIEGLESEINASIDRATALRQSILKRAFSGQLVPQDPNDEPASVLLERIRAERVQPATPKKQRAPKRKEITA